jgi:hypothetical protein
MANPTGRGGFMRGRSGNPGGRPRQLASVTPDEIKALDERVAMIESDQGVLALTDETESPKPGNIENHEQTAGDHP